MKSKILLFTTAMLQTTFVAMNVVFISKELIIPMLITGFCISLVWTMNVTRIAFSSWRDRIIYSTGAATGGGIGFYLSHYMLTQGI